MKNPEFSIIIPCKEKTKYLEECINKIKEMSYNLYEIIIIPDKKFELNDKNIKIIPLNAGPAEKRDLGVKKSKGKIIAFIDDDAYPDKDWLKNSLKYFKYYDAVGGPQVTPPSDSFTQKLSGYTFASILMGGLKARYTPTKKFEIDDWPTVNFLVKKEAFQDVGGFDSNYYPGEDTKLCLDLIKKGYKMIYAPDVIVYHHRRKGIKAHIKQISNYAIHRGYFVKKLPKTSLRITYFLPLLFVVYLILGMIISFFNNLFRNIFLLSILLYLLIGFIDGIRLSKNIKYASCLPFYIFLTHFFYGVNFIKGLISTKLVR